METIRWILVASGTLSDPVSEKSEKVVESDCVVNWEEQVKVVVLSNWISRLKELIDQTRSTWMSNGKWCNKFNPLWTNKWKSRFEMEACALEGSFWLDGRGCSEGIYCCRKKSTSRGIVHNSIDRVHLLNKNPLPPRDGCELRFCKLI